MPPPPSCSTFQPEIQAHTMLSGNATCMATEQLAAAPMEATASAEPAERGL